jgi:DNA-binding transcriptional regulator YdaS (Cro superfamily)
MEPAHRIITVLGGPSVVADRIGIHRTRVSKWQSPRDSGGTGGMIPIKHIPALVQLAKERGVSLSADDFLPFITKTPEGT